MHYHLQTPDLDEYELLVGNNSLLNTNVFSKISALKAEIRKIEFENPVDQSRILEFMVDQESFNSLLYTVDGLIRTSIMVKFYSSRIKGTPTPDDFKALSDEDFIQEQWFNYFSDIFFVQLSTCFDLLGLFLKDNLNLDINSHQVDFKSVCTAIKGYKYSNLPLADVSLNLKKAALEISNKITSDNDFNKANEYRIGVVHKLSFSHPFSTIKKQTFPDKVIKSIGTVYISPSVRLKLIDKCTKMFIDSIEIFSGNLKAQPEDSN
ncbi:Cthe_2314 family HEPN domain-containing protein [Pedobacter antarcticus]|uniref:Cthe_2314 family HEPN domain-containing protein n=1 Tax=Pedobacter antarcticus TaxID=34086 RepID=UPI00292E6EEB|nr:Cthe_2314 family HEPN domain-containing protein [Pedobacter antarcticus]